MSILGIGALALGAGANMISGIDANKRQKEAAETQFQNQKNLMELSQQQQLAMWNQTNIGAQKKHLQEAGMNAGLLYGMSGGGGATTGSGGAPSAGKADVTPVNTSGIMELGIMGAQKKLLEAQAEKEQAIADKTKGVDTEIGKQEVTGKTFANKLNETIGIDEMLTRYNQQTEKEGYEKDKTQHDYNAWKAGAFGNKATDDLNTPLAKAYKAGFDKVVTELNNAKAQGDVTKAQAVIENYKAELAKDGIAPDSDAWTKTILTLLKKTGILNWLSN